MRRLCTVDDVKRYVDVTGRWSDDEINKEIEYQTEDIYEEVGQPIAAMVSPIERDGDDNVYLTYYIGEPNVYNVDRLFVGTTTKFELKETEDYDVSRDVGMVRFARSTVARSGMTTSPTGTVSYTSELPLDTDQEVLIYYVPQLFAKYCALRTSENLLEGLDIIDNGKDSKELKVIRRRLAIQEKLINHRLGVAMSSRNVGYDPVYKMNLKKIRQDHSYNEYLWKED